MEVREEYIKHNLHTKENANKSISKRLVKSKKQFEKSLVSVCVKSVAYFIRDSTKINIEKQNSSYTSRASVNT